MTNKTFRVHQPFEQVEELGQIGLYRYWAGVFHETMGRSGWLKYEDNCSRVDSVLNASQYPQDTFRCNLNYPVTVEVENCFVR